MEPSNANFLVHTLNTSACSRIRRLNVAVWGHSTSLTIASTSGGDWANQFNEDVNASTTMPALSLSDILASGGWESADFLKCDIEGAELNVFEKNHDLIGNMFDCCAIELHELASPGCTRLVHNTFHESHFSTEQSGEFKVFQRRAKKPSNKIKPAAISIIKPSFGSRQIELLNVVEASWAYYVFDGDSCQLHPTSRDEQPATFLTMVEMHGQTRFEAGIEVVNPLGYAVDFTVQITCETTNKVVTLSTRTVCAGEKLSWVLPFFAPAYGTHKIQLSTKMSVDSPTSHQAIANWHSPRFTS